jgi:dephospho-CoA kinase
MKVLLVGGIGAGKTTVSKIFEELGIPIFNFDTVNRNLLLTNESVQNMYRDVLGHDCFTDNYKLNHKYLDIFFKNKYKRDTIQHFMGKLIFGELNYWYSQQTSPYIIVECAQGLEVGLDKRFDKVISVIASYDEKNDLLIRYNRVMKRDGDNQARFDAISSHQSSHNDLIKYASYVICTEKDIKSQVITCNTSIIFETNKTE